MTWFHNILTLVKNRETCLGIRGQILYFLRCFFDIVEAKIRRVSMGVHSSLL